MPLPSVGGPTIERVLAEFLAEERGRLSAKTAGNYEYVIKLLTAHLDSYA